ncbi:glycosyltransferase [Klebsiella quasipneumoniae]|nr:glycosyltransferase [Klebsiella quasipneumoniae]EIY5073681.1 glycosyltransferase [Klebsiella quasipneumoniae]HCC2618128.1 glycosyltransferase [Klebsiella quasipneumoniae]HDK6111262.1 glycosyltransferase [Klebsiella quasipneumoniae]
MKKILIISHTGDISFFKIGSHHYANGLAQNNLVSYIGTPTSLAHKLMRKTVRGEKKLDDVVNIIKPITIFPITIKYNKICSSINKLFWQLSLLNLKKNKFDVVICDYPYFEPLLCLLNYKILVYRPTDNYLQMSGVKVKYYERKIIDKSNIVIGTSQDVIENLKKQYPDELREKKRFVISNGFDHLHFDSSNKNAVRTGSVYIGSLDYRFDFDALEVLCKKFPNDLFDIYGPIERNSEDKVSILKEKYNNLNFYGAVSYNDVPVILSKYKIGLLLLNNHLSNKGRSPMKLWEYAASGLQVLYSQVEHESTYDFLFKYDKYDLVEKYLLAYQMPYNQDIKKSLMQYSWHNKVREIENIISEFINDQ